MIKLKRQNLPKKADAILAADLHLRPDTPQCRTDDFLAVQDNKLGFILDLCKKNDCPLLVAGDFGHKSLSNGWPTWFLRHTINKLSDVQIFTIFGQHDLPNNRLALWKQSGIGVLEAAKVLTVLEFPKVITNKIILFPFSFGQKMYDAEKYKDDDICVAMVHQMIIKDVELWPGQQAQTGSQLLKRFPGYTLILSGDNHQSFTVKYKNQLLVNSGSMMRTTCAQTEHKPRVYLWYAKENKVIPVFLPIEQNVISRMHIEIAEERNKRMMEAYTKYAREDVEIELSYTDNMRRYLETHRTQGRVKFKIQEALNKS